MRAKIVIFYKYFKEFGGEIGPRKKNYKCAKTQVDQDLR